jgi:hypothetical protein
MPLCGGIRPPRAICSGPVRISAVSFAASPPSERYLELAGLDLEDDRALDRLFRRLGPLGVRYRDYALFASFPGFAERVRPALVESRAAQPVVPETREELVFGVRVLRDLMRAYTSLREGMLADDGAAHVRFESVPEGVDPLGRDWRGRLERLAIEPGPRAQAEIFLVTVLNDGLTPFAPRVALEHAATLPPAPLYARFCLELYVHLAERALYRRCANEPCGRIFVRQRGRAQAGRHRTRGLKYCSRACARAAAQRAYRRRRASAAPG